MISYWVIWSLVLKRALKIRNYIMLIIMRNKNEKIRRNSRFPRPLEDSVLFLYLKKAWRRRLAMLLAEHQVPVWCYSSEYFLYKTFRKQVRKLHGQKQNAELNVKYQPHSNSLILGCVSETRREREGERGFLQKEVFSPWYYMATSRTRMFLKLSSRSSWPSFNILKTKCMRRASLPRAPQEGSLG